eukprot:NODE_32_length_37098_cov_1.132760.p11 type:complete len:352 gc:universal NODE_32_length_37098_cov_1.132760:15524-14469(-)
MKNKILQPIDEIKVSFDLNTNRSKKKKPYFPKVKKNAVMDKMLLKKKPEPNINSPVIQENRYITAGRTAEVIEKDEPLTFHQQLMLDTSIYINMEEVKKEGVHIYRIEDMIPNPYPYSILNIYDAYLLFKAEGEEVKFCKWIGPNATADKKTSSTIWAVGCRALLQIFRTEEYFDGEEIYGLSVEYDQENSVPSSLKPRIDDNFIRVYKIVGKKNPQGILVAPFRNSLTTDGAFIIDCGTIIYVWQGEQATLVEKSKTFMIANTIKYNRGGKLEIKVIEEDFEPRDFRELLPIKNESEELSKQSLNEVDDEQVENSLQVYHSKQNMASLQSLIMLNDKDWYEAAQSHIGYM